MLVPSTVKTRKPNSPERKQPAPERKPSGAPRPTSSVTGPLHPLHNLLLHQGVASSRTGVLSYHLGLLHARRPLVTWVSLSEFLRTAIADSPRPDGLEWQTLNI